METARQFKALARRGNHMEASMRELAQEVAVAISYNGVSHAVIMATPADLEDLALGFSLSESIISSPGQIEDINVLEGELGFDVQVRLDHDATDRLADRRRAMAGPVGCGLCGLESIEAAMRDIPRVNSRVQLTASDVARAVRSMADAQSLNARTRSVHAAACYGPGQGLLALREDVGRHNALDKLVGAMALQEGLSKAAIVLSSRVSIELVQKAAQADCGILLAVSAPTMLAVNAAEKASITLVAIARGDEFEIFTHQDRIRLGDLPHVA